MTIVFNKYPPRYQNVSGDSLYADVANHCQRWTYYSSGLGQTSAAHEATHGVNSQVRNGASQIQAPEDIIMVHGVPQPFHEMGVYGEGINGFYVFKDRSIVLKEPPIRKRDAIPFVPTWFRKSRFPLYIAGQTAWDACPLYIFDEWVAYTNGALVGIDLKKRGEYKDGMTDVTYGSCEFIAYGLAMLMAADAAGGLTPDLAAFSRFQLRRAFNAYYMGKGIWPFGEDELILKLTVEQEGQVFRDFCKNKLDFTFPADVVDEEKDADITRLTKDDFKLI